MAVLTEIRTERGIRPFSDFNRYNVIELEGLGNTLNESRLRYHVGRTLVMENPAGKPSRQGMIGLTIVTVHKPRKLLAKNRYGFVQIAAWKFRAVVLHDLPITIIVLRELQMINGGEPLAWLQLLEPDRKRRALVWSYILKQKIPGNATMKSIMMKLDKEAYMTIAEELRAEGRAEGLTKGRHEGETAGVLKAKAQVVRNMLRKGYDVDTILEIAGISRTQFDTLQADQHN